MMTDDPLTPYERALLEEFQRRQSLAESANRMRESLYEFTVAAWSVLEPGSPFILNWHIKAICDIIQYVLENWLNRRRGMPVDLEKYIQNILINIPPGTAKSRIVGVMAPCWFWLTCPDWRAIFFSGNPRISSRDSAYRRDLIESEWYKKTFKPTWQLKQDQNAKLQFNNTAGGFLSALTAGQRIIGDRADALFIDDPNDATELSDDIRMNLNELWWDQGAANRVNDAQISVRIGIMQRLHEDDWSGHVLKEKVGDKFTWWHVCFRQEYEPERMCPCGRENCTTPLGKLDPRTEPGELLFPARFPKDVLEQEKIRLRAAGYAGQHQQQPFAPGGGILKRDSFQFYLEDPRKVKFDEIFQSWDLSFKKTKTSDFVCGQVWGIRGPNWYLLDREYGRFDFDETLARIKLLSKRWPGAVAKFIEDKANGPAVITALRKSLPGIIPVNPQGGKEARAHAIMPLIEGHNVYLPSAARCPWVESFLGECEAFPNGLHDDQVDAMTQALVKTMNRDYKVKVDNRTPDEKIWDDVVEADKEAQEADRLAEALDDWEGMGIV